MATGVRGVASNNTGTGTAASLVVTFPAGCQVGDQAYFEFNIGAGSGITDTGSASGWTKIGSQVNSFSSSQNQLYTKTLTSGDISTGTVTGLASAARNLTGILVVASGGTHESASAAQTDNGGTSGTILAATPTLNDSLEMSFVTAAADTSNSARNFAAPTTPAGWTEQVEAWTTQTGSSRQGAVCFTRQLTGGGGSSTGTATWSVTGGNVRAQGFTVILAPSSAAAIGAATLALTASGVAAVTAAGTASIALSATGNAVVPTAGSASLALSANAAASAPAAGSATLALSASGTAQAAAAGSAILVLSASGSARGVAAGSAALSLTASGTTSAAAAGSASLALTASGGVSAPATGSAALALTAVGAASTPATGSASLALNATGTALGGGATSGTASLSLSASAGAGGQAAGASGTASVSLTATGPAQASIAGAATLNLSASGATAARVAGAATLGLDGLGALSGVAAGQALLALTATGDARAGTPPTDLRDITATATLVRDWHAGPLTSSWVADLAQRGRHASLERDWSADIIRDWKAAT